MDLNDQKVEGEETRYSLFDPNRLSSTTDIRFSIEIFEICETKAVTLSPAKARLIDLCKAEFRDPSEKRTLVGHGKYIQIDHVEDSGQPNVDRYIDDRWEKEKKPVTVGKLKSSDKHSTRKPSLVKLPSLVWNPKTTSKSKFAQEKSEDPKTKPKPKSTGATIPFHEPTAVGRAGLTPYQGQDELMSLEQSRPTRSVPRVLFKMREDAWSMFANPSCDCTCYCGNKPRPRLIFRPDSRDLHRQRLQASASTPAVGRSSIRPEAEMLRSLGRLENNFDDSYTFARTSNWVCNLPKDVEPVSENGPLLGSASLPVTPVRSRSLADLTNLSTVATMPGNHHQHGDRRGRSRECDHECDHYDGVSDSMLRGNFIPLSNLARSPSPKRDNGVQPSREVPAQNVFVQFNLTDDQVNQIATAEDSNDESHPRGRAAQPTTDAARATDNKEVASKSSRAKSPSKAQVRNGSPSRSRARSRSPLKFFNFGNKTPEKGHAKIKTEDVGIGPSSSIKHQKEARFAETDPIPNPKGKQTRHVPPPIDTGLAQAWELEDPGKQPVTIVHNPPECPNEHKRRSTKMRNAPEPALYRMPDDTSSFYSTNTVGERYPSAILPLRIKKEPVTPEEQILLDQLQSQVEFGDIPIRASIRASSPPSQYQYGQFPQEHSHAGAHFQGVKVHPVQHQIVENNNAYIHQSIRPTIQPALLGQNERLNENISTMPSYVDNRTSMQTSKHSFNNLHWSLMSVPLNDAYSPLAQLLGPEYMMTGRVASKVLIGEHGWLEDTSRQVEHVPDANRNSSTGFLGSLVKLAKDFRRSRDSDSKQNSRAMPISMAPREQAIFYSELEWTMSHTVHNFITAQFNAGRLDTEKLRKVAEDWQRRGHSRATGFRFDLETQLELCRLHVGDFQFYNTKHNTSQASLLSVIEANRSNARAFKIRTYVTPDTVIAKWLLDCQSLLNIITVADEPFIELGRLVRFFRRSVEAATTMAKAKDEQSSKIGSDIVGSATATAGSSTAATSTAAGSGNGAPPAATVTGASAASHQAVLGSPIQLRPSHTVGGPVSGNHGHGYGHGQQRQNDGWWNGRGSILDPAEYAEHE